MEYPELDSDGIGFKYLSYTYNEDEGYNYIEYNGREYFPYGTIGGMFNTPKMDKCIGYIVQDENATSMVDLNNKDTRIYTLEDDKDNNFLMEYYIASSEMNQPSFYRAYDTKDKDIYIPKYINSLDYSIWK